MMVVVTLLCSLLFVARISSEPGLTSGLGQGLKFKRICDGRRDTELIPAITQL